MRVLDLFSGIGGFSLGLERAGMTTVAFCEFDKACQKVLKKHWPDTPIYDDVRILDGTNLQGTVDVICGGFPCQDISFAGKGAGLEGKRSGLWWEFYRLIKEIEPSYVIAENVSALRSRGLDKILGSLNEIGYDAEWHCIPASAVGAPHQRDRIWIVAYPNTSRYAAYKNDTYADGATIIKKREIQSFFESCRQSWWSIEPNVGRVANGIPRRLHRLRQLGNAVVPQIPELIGRAIMESK